MLIANEVHKSYAMGRAQLEVLQGCTLQVGAGEFVAIMGKSGSGKSTLLHILGALDVPQRGQVFFENIPVCTPLGESAGFAANVDRAARVLQLIITFFYKYAVLPILLLTLAFSLLVALVQLLIPATVVIFPVVWLIVQAALALLGLAVLVFPFFLGVLFVRLLLADIVERRRIGLRRSAFGIVFQFYHLLPELNVLENVLLARMVGTGIFGWLGQSGPAKRDALEILKRVSLADRLKHRPSELSGGERQRVAIARALVHKPKILFADEPTGNLDREAAAELMVLLKGLHAEGQTIVMVTHDAGVAAQADRVMMLENGKLCQIQKESLT